MAEPKVRFKRDDGGSYPAWNYIPFGDIYKKVIEKNDLSFGKDKMISVANMYYKKSDSRDVLDDDYMKTYNIMRLGDIAFEGNKSKYFAHGRFVENTIGDGIVSHVFDVFRPTRPYVLEYWKEYINYEPIMGKVLLRCTKSSTMMTNLAADDFLQQKIFVPCLEEQQKIADFLSSVDEVITASEQEVASLETQKKAVMKKIFSQEARFKKPDGSEFPEWEHLLLMGIIEELSSGKSVNSLPEEPDNTDIAVLKTSCVYHDMFNINERKKVAFDEIGLVKCPVEKSSIIVSRMNTPEWVGACGYVTEDYENVFLPDRLWKLRVIKEKAIPYFIYQLLISPSFKNQILGLASGTSKSMFNISQNGFLSLRLLLPCLEEQRLIADFLSSFDEAISEARRELELWKKLKKGLLQQMFV